MGEFRSGDRRPRRCAAGDHSPKRRRRRLRAGGPRQRPADDSNRGERRSLSRHQRDTNPHISRNRQRRAKRGEEPDFPLAGALRRDGARPRPTRRGPLADDAARRGATRRTPDKRSTRAQPMRAPAPRGIRRSAPAAIGPSASLGRGQRRRPISLATGAGPIAVSQLAERLASAGERHGARRRLVQPASAAGAGTAQAVKELQIDLDPADLGAVSVTMRLAEGKLSIVMEVATPSTLKAIEGERDAIADRLGLTSSVARNPDHQADRDERRRTPRATMRKIRNPEARRMRKAIRTGSLEGMGSQSSRRESAADQGDPQALRRASLRLAAGLAICVV